MAGALPAAPAPSIPGLVKMDYETLTTDELLEEIKKRGLLDRNKEKKEKLKQNG